MLKAEAKGLAAKINATTGYHTRGLAPWVPLTFENGYRLLVERPDRSYCIVADAAEWNKRDELDTYRYMCRIGTGVTYAFKLDSAGTIIGAAGPTYYPNATREALAGWFSPVYYNILSAATRRLVAWAHDQSWERHDLLDPNTRIADLERTVSKLHAAIDQSITDCMPLGLMVDDPNAEEMVQHLAQQLGEALQ